MGVVHRLTGYEKMSEFLAVEHDIPRDILPSARHLAVVPATETSWAAAYPLAPSAAQRLAALMNITIDIDRYDWFFEPFSVLH